MFNLSKENKTVKRNKLNFFQVLTKMELCNFKGTIEGTNVAFKAENDNLYILGMDKKWHPMDPEAEDVINLLFCVA